MGRRMNIKDLEIIKSDERGIMYNCDKVKFLFRKKATINANRSHEDLEVLYLVKGEAKLTIGDKTKTVKAPIKIEIPRNTCHKLVALTDIELIEDRKGE